MDHSEAVRLQAAERYLLGELSREQRDDYEEHYFECAECAQELKTTAAFLEGARQVVREDAHARVVEREKDRAKARWLAWLRPAYMVPAFAALIIVIGYQNLRTIPQLKQAGSQATTAHVVKSFPLMSVRAQGAGLTTVRVHWGEGFDLEADLPPAKTPEGYVCEVQDKTGRTQFTLPVSAEEAKRTVHFSVPGGLLDAGQHSLVVFAAQSVGASGKGEEIERLPFFVEISQ